jgi:hypothetical protein
MLNSVKIVERHCLVIVQQMRVLIGVRKPEMMEVPRTGMQKAVGCLEFLLQVHLSLEVWVQGQVQHG